MNERIVALDVGDRRIGIAVSDALGITAQPIETYTRVGYGPDVRRICQIAQQYETNRILCGLPLNMDGSRGFQAEKVAQLAEKLEEAGLVVSYYDERMTTVLAEDALLEANMSRENRKKKVDMVAAVMILQSYLDAQAMQSASVDADADESDEDDGVLEMEDEDGNVTVVHCTYDPATKGGNAPDGRKVKGTIHWVEASQAGKAEVRLYENIVDEEKGVYNKEDGSLNVNPNSLTKVTAYVEPALMEAKGYDSFQFVRTGFFCADIHDSKEGAPVFNRIVSLKSSFKLPKA